MKQEMMGWQWDQLDHMQIICILLQTDNHAVLFIGWMLFLMHNKQCQSTEGKTGSPKNQTKHTSKIKPGFAGFWKKFSGQ